MIPDTLAFVPSTFLAMRPILFRMFWLIYSMLHTSRVSHVRKTTTLASGENQVARFSASTFIRAVSAPDACEPRWRSVGGPLKQVRGVTPRFEWVFGHLVCSQQRDRNYFGRSRVPWRRHKWTGECLSLVVHGFVVDGFCCCRLDVKHAACPLDELWFPKCFCEVDGCLSLSLTG